MTQPSTRSTAPIRRHRRLVAAAAAVAVLTVAAASAAAAPSRSAGTTATPDLAKLQLGALLSTKPLQLRQSEAFTILQTMTRSLQPGRQDTRTAPGPGP